MNRTSTKGGRKSLRERWEQCASADVGCVPTGATLLKGPPAGTSKAGIQCVFIFSGFPIGGGPNDSWPRCAFLLAFSDSGPKGHRGPRVLQRGQKSQVQQKRQNQG